MRGIGPSSLATPVVDRLDVARVKAEQDAKEPDSRVGSESDALWCDRSACQSLGFAVRHPQTPAPPLVTTELGVTWSAPF